MRAPVAPGTSSGLWFRRYQGLGDHVYMRPFVAAAADAGAETWVSTPWPELYWDRPDIRLVQYAHGLRTQVANVERADPARWSPEPCGASQNRLQRIALDYVSEGFRKDRSVYAAFSAQLGGVEPQFRLPIAPAWRDECTAWLHGAGWDGTRGVGVIRPPTVRTEWLNPARNPLPEYLLAAKAARPDLFWVAVGWAEGDAEQLVLTSAGPSSVDPPLGLWGDAHALHGEMHWTTLAALIEQAELVVTGPCFLLPLGVAVRARTLCIFGGHVPNRWLVDARMGLERYRHVEPDPPCACLDRTHACNKILDFERVLDAALDLRW